jgi:hypothetical protein
MFATHGNMMTVVARASDRTSVAVTVCDTTELSPMKGARAVEICVVRLEPDAELCGIGWASDG